MGYDDDDDISHYDTDVECCDYDHDDDMGEVDDNAAPEKDVNFTVLTSDDIRARVDEAASEIASLLSVSMPEAVVLLCKYGWNSSDEIYQDWFSDEAKTRKNCGLMTSSDGMKTDTAGHEFFCGMCLENYDGVAEDDRGVSSSCGHVFCKTCWRSYVTTSIADGVGCLSLRCPQPKCGASAVGIIETFLTKEDRLKYDNHVLRSYVESMKNLRWCPSPGCEFIIKCEFRGFGATNSHLDVICKCKHGFCLNCSEENHSPSDCALVAKWTLKNNSESENKNWIVVNTKPCPKCGRSIEKNEGCMHMTCRAPCRFQFCWICLQPYSSHASSCNRYEVSKNGGDVDRAQQIREKARNDLNKYIHYHERWTENHKSNMKAMESRKKFAEQHIETLGEIIKQRCLKFMTEAWDQIVECRRFLKWSYAYGYYIPDEEPAKRRFFEVLQGDAEVNLEKLHDLVESEGSKHIMKAEAILMARAKLEKAEITAMEEIARAEVQGFPARVLNQTTVTRRFFDNLIEALANHLSDVHQQHHSDSLYCNPTQLLYYFTDELF